MEKVVTVTRIILGTIFFVLGLNGFFTFIPVPEFHPFMEILVDSGYIYLVKSIEVIGGLLLLTNRFVPLALALLLPVIVNIAAYHALLDPRNGSISLILIFFSAILLLHYKSFYKPFFSARGHISQEEE